MNITHTRTHGTQHNTLGARGHTEANASERAYTTRTATERENAARRANRSFCDPRRKKVNAKFAAGLHYLVSAQLFTRGRESKFQTRQAKVAGFLPFLFPTFDNNMLRVYECNVCVRALRSCSVPPSQLCFYSFPSRRFATFLKISLAFLRIFHEIL
jgi:hypothetical protein